MLDNENPGVGSPKIERVSSLPSDAVAGIMMKVDMGIITYYVFDSDRAARAWVKAVCPGQGAKNAPPITESNTSALRDR